MSELLALIKDILSPIILSYVFITTTGFTVTIDVIKTFKKKIDIEGYEFVGEKGTFKEKMEIISLVLTETLNPITSLSIILGILTNQKDILESMKEKFINDGTIVPKNSNGNTSDSVCDNNDNSLEENKLNNEEIQEKIIKKDNNNNCMSNEEKLKYLKSEKDFLINSSVKESEQEKIDEFVLTKRF